MEAKIGPADVKRLREKLDVEGWDKATLDLFDQEITLAEHMTGEVAKMRVRLTHAGVGEKEIEGLMVHLVRLVLEPTLLIDRAHKQMWEEFLPGPDVTTKFVTPSRRFGAMPRSFAIVDWHTRHIQSIRPDLTEFEAKIFLELHQGLISGPMRDAGWVAIARLLQNYQPGGRR